MGRILQAAFYGLVCTAFGGVVYYVIASIVTLLTNGDIMAVLPGTAIACAVSWGLLTLVFYDIIGSIEHFNKRGRRSRKDQHPDEGSDKDQDHDQDDRGPDDRE